MGAGTSNNATARCKEMLVSWIISIHIVKFHDYCSRNSIGLSKKTCYHGGSDSSESLKFDALLLLKALSFIRDYNTPYVFDIVPEVGEDMDPSLCWPGSRTYFGRADGETFTALDWPEHKWQAFRA